MVHATAIARHGSGGWRGVLLRGASGAGKSDLALRAMAAGWRLVADDRTRVWRSGGALYGCAPATLAGLVEARGVGVVAVAARAFVRLALVVDCVAASEALERIPEPGTALILQARLPRLRLHACEASALAKLSLALDNEASI